MKSRASIAHSVVCLPGHRYVEEINTTAMLATKMLAGVTPMVNLREDVHLCQVQIRLPTLALKPRWDVTRSPKQGYQWCPTK